MTKALHHVFTWRIYNAAVTLMVYDWNWIVNHPVGDITCKSRIVPPIIISYVSGLNLDLGVENRWVKQLPGLLM